MAPSGPWIIHGLGGCPGLDQGLELSAHFHPRRRDTVEWDKVERDTAERDTVDRDTVERDRM